MDEPTVVAVEVEIQAVNAIGPTILAPWNRRALFSHDSAGWGPIYRMAALQTYVAGAVGRLEAALEDVEAAPVTQSRPFAYVSNAALKSIVARDYREAQRAYIAECWKSTIILAGGLIEAILLDALHKDPAKAVGAAAAPNKADLNRWDLSELIDVSVELKIVGPGVQKLSHSVREFRNLVHAGNELAKNLQFGPEEARIALEVLHIVDRDLS